MSFIHTMIKSNQQTVALYQKFNTGLELLLVFSDTKERDLFILSLRIFLPALNSHDYLLYLFFRNTYFDCKDVIHFVVHVIYLFC